MYFKNFSYVAIGRVASAGLQGIFYLMFAILLEPEAYGQMSYLIAIAGTFSVISRFGLPFTVTVYQAKKNQIKSNQINFLAVITTSAAAIILLFIDIFAAFLCLGLSFFVMAQQNLLGLQEYKKHMWISVIVGALIIIIPTLLFFVMNISGIILGMGIATFFSSYYFLKLLKKTSFSLNQVSKSFKVIIHNFGLDVSVNLPRMIDKLAIVPLLGFSFAGIYQFNLQILFLLEILPASLHSFLLSEESRGNINKKIVYLAVFGSVLITIVIIFISPFIVEQLFPNFTDGILGLQIIVISITPLTISAILNAKLQARESTKIGYSAIVRIGSLLALIVFLGSQYELVGLSLSVLISIILTTIFFLYLYFIEGKNESSNISKKSFQDSS